jgi:hypothetical protein
MATCEYCEQEMTTGATCTVRRLHVEGAVVRLAPHRPPRRRGVTSGERCGDCGVRPGGFHHPGCDLQRCPLCHDQLLSCACIFDEDEDEEEHDEGPVDRYFDGNGVPTERRWIGGQEVIIHYDDVPPSDITVLHGIPVTTALRTVIDIAPDLPDDRLRGVVEDCLSRQLFTIDEAKERLAQDDMRTRPGAMRMRALLPTFE